MRSVPLVTRVSDQPTERWSDPVRGEIDFRTLFGDGDTETDSLTAGVADLEPGGWLGHHRHEPTEVYYVLTGRGTVILDGDEHEVSAGSAVFIPSMVEHGIRNHAEGERLRVFYVLDVDSMGDVDYRFSGERPA
jgi:quercetin dioxygenase-like cupin family protein